jgi:hypothetical protein
MDLTCRSPAVATTWRLVLLNGPLLCAGAFLLAGAQAPASTAIDHPSVPTGLTATAASSSQINLSWTASADSPTGYSASQGDTKIDAVTGTSYSNTGLSASTGYTYSVAADNPEGTSAQSASARATTTSTGGPSSGRNSPASDPFPRTAVFMIGGHFPLLHSGNTAAGVPTATVVAQSSLVTINAYLGVESYGTYSSLMQQWKAGAAANRLTLRTFIYTPGFAPQYANAIFPWLTANFNNSSMWAYTSASGRGTTDLAPYNGDGANGQSYLQITPYDTQTVSPSFSFNGKTGVLAGYNVWNLYAQYYYDVYVNGLAVSKYGESAGPAPNSELDGIFLDNEAANSNTTSPATWNGLGTPPVQNAAADAAIQQGIRKQVQAFKALNPNLLLMGNYNLAANITNPGFTVDPSQIGLWDVIFNEAVIGQSFSIETWNNSPPGAFMQGLIKSELAIAPGGTLIFAQSGLPGGSNGLTGNQSGWSSRQWQAVRYGFAAAMQRNYHYLFNCGQQAYSCIGLTDEQVQKVSGSPNYGWLSAGTQRLDAPQSAPWSNGVWRRRFPNGWVLWNPRGNRAQTVTVPSTLCRITTRGYGDPSVNTGACGATTVTLQDADGLFLIGTG